MIVTPVKYLSQSDGKPFLSPCTPEAYQNFKDKIREDVCENANGDRNARIRNSKSY